MLVCSFHREIVSWIAFIGKNDTVQLEAVEDIEVETIDSFNCLFSKITLTKLSETLLKLKTPSVKSVWKFDTPRKTSTPQDKLKKGSQTGFSPLVCPSVIPTGNLKITFTSTVLFSVEDGLSFSTKMVYLLPI